MVFLIMIREPETRTKVSCTWPVSHQIQENESVCLYHINVIQHSPTGRNFLSITFKVSSSLENVTFYSIYLFLLFIYCVLLQRCTSLWPLAQREPIFLKRIMWCPDQTDHLIFHIQTTYFIILSSYSSLWHFPYTTYPTHTHSQLYDVRRKVRKWLSLKCFCL